MTYVCLDSLAFTVARVSLEPLFAAFGRVVQDENRIAPISGKIGRKALLNLIVVFIWEKAESAKAEPRLF